MIKVFHNFPPEKGRKTKQIKRWKLPEIIAFPSLLFSILHIKLLFWAHRSKVCVEFYAESYDAVWQMDSKPPTSQLTGGEQNLEALSQTFNTIVQECKVIFYRLNSKFFSFWHWHCSSPHFLSNFFFLWLRFSIKCPRSALQDNTNTTGRVRGILNIKPVKFLIPSFQYLLICCLLNFLINSPMQESLKI